MGDWNGKMTEIQMWVVFVSGVVGGLTIGAGFAVLIMGNEQERGDEH